jgi:hypothetical protein
VVFIFYIITIVRKIWIRLTDGRVRAAVKALELVGLGIGDLAARPGDAATFFRPIKIQLYAAIKEGKPASLAAVSAVENFAARLEKAFADMQLLQAPPDRAALEALKLMQRACAAAPGLLSTAGRKRADLEGKACCAQGRKTLALAKVAVEGAGFPQNLKFSSIYSGLDAAFDALERCGEALFKA